MLKKVTLSFIASLFIAFSVSAQGATGASVKGKVVDKSGEPLPFVNVAILQNGNVKSGATTDFDGKYKIANIDAGKYDLTVKFVGYKTYKIEGVVVKGGQLLPMKDIVLSESSELLEVVEVVTYKVPLIDKDGGASGGTVTREDLARMPGRSAASIATTVGGVQSDANGNITSIRGSRSDATYYYIDGIKVRGSSSLPKSAIEEVSVITGGLPANYGDATGGIISITTRGASRFYFGGVEVVSSGFKLGEKTYGLDHYGYNLIEGIVAGPLLMKKDSTGKKTDPLLGFFISGNFTSAVDSRPLGLTQYRITDSARAELTENPLRPTGTGFGAFYNTDFLNTSDFQEVKFRQNVPSKNASLAGKIDVNVGPNVNLTFGGSGSYSNYLAGSWGGSLMNYDNYPLIQSFSWRTYGKFTQRFQSIMEEGEESKGGVKNAFYTIMVDYSKNNSKTQDAKHKDNLFGYGYVGKFEVEQAKSYEFRDFDGDGQVDRVHNGLNDVEVTFTPDTSDLANAELAAITNQYYTLYDDVFENYENFTQLLDGGALLNGMLPASVYGLWTNMGTQYNGYSKTDATQFRVTAQGSADIGDHAIAIGFEYEQRTDRSFSVSPVGLWTLGRLLANSHTDNGRALDESDYYVTQFGTFSQYDFATLSGAGATYEGGGEQSFFDYNVRNAQGMNPTGSEYLNIDELDPSTFSLDMFSADELLNQGSNYVSYYGYDYKGNKSKDNPTFNDFFTETDEFGNFTRPMGAFEPIYMSGYIMDKFAFDDLIFNVGLRVDRFDANQQVLKDKYLLYSARTVGEVSDIDGVEIIHPENIPDNAIVYVNDIDDPTGINGYRVEDTWYNAFGAEVTDPSVLETSAGIAPYLQDGVNPSDNISQDVFEDYTPQIVVMPRIAFSFPISDEALFFAHYDILSKRPTTGNRLNPLDYYYMKNRNVVVNNPDLRPEKTIDYELGFQQVLSKRSSLKLSVFYREQRDQVSLINVTNAYPRTYRTWGNIDFGTIKGMTVAYDLRRSGNITLRAAYTLQFAEGTGSDASSSLNLINSGQPNLRTIFPYSYDQRHQLTGTVDFRYGEGKDYNGPVMGGKQILKNTGINMVINGSSGTPYSAQEQISPAAPLNPTSGTLDGTVNGSRKPWQVRSDMQIDKNIILKFGKGEEKKKSANLNVYLLVNNVLNTINITNVYRATGNPDDDGYLNAATYQAGIQSQNDEASFRYLYALKANNPYNYGIPRTIRIGAKLDF